VDVFPTLSVAVTVTVVFPTANVLPLAGEYANVGLPTLSVPVAPLKVTTAPLADVALTVTLAGTFVSTGATVSTTPALESTASPNPEARPRARRNPSHL
jgi:hypothetical protein